MSFANTLNLRAITRHYSNFVLRITIVIDYDVKAYNNMQ